MTGYKSKKKAAEDKVQVVKAPAKKKTTKSKATEVWPKVTVGSHLTVTTFEDGRTELKWDDEALARDVREAIAGFESQQKPSKKPRKTKV